MSWTRIECLRFIEKLRPKDEKIFRLIENLAISDEMETVRSYALRILNKLFPEKSISILKWSFDNDISTHKLSVYKRRLPYLTMLDLLSQNNDSRLKEFRERLFIEIEPNIENYVKESVVPEEAIVLAMIERQICLKLNKIKDNEEIDFSRELLHYKIDKKGHVVGIYLMSGGDGWSVHFIPKHISIMIYLKELYFSNCVIKEIPDSIGKLKLLEILNLNFNYIDEIPYTIGALTFLKELNLSYNKLHRLPASFAQLTSLERLDIAYNKFKELPECVAFLKNLKTLNFSKCKKNDVEKHIHMKGTFTGYGCLDCNHEWEDSLATKERKVTCVKCNSKNVYYFVRE